MALVFQPDPTLAGFNSFCTTTFADDYQSTKMNDAWAAITNSTAEKLLIWASRQLSTIDFQGSKTVIDQPLEWPRRYVWIKGGTADSEIYDSFQFDWNTVPVFMQEACADFAGYLLDGDTTEPTGLEGLKRLKVDSIEIEANATDRLSWLPKSSRDLMRRYMLNSGSYSTNTIRVG